MLRIFLDEKTISKTVELIQEEIHMVQAEPLVTAVKEETAKIDACMKADLARLEPTTDPLLVEVLRFGLFNGGKRIRPLLVVFAARLCGCADESVYRLGCAFEYLHAATLFHDDIIDNSETRRGKKSVFREFGTIEAILAGDYLHALAMSTVGRMAGKAGLEIFCGATTGMVDGEFMQLRNAAKHTLSELQYHEAIMMKTGLLIAAACEVGAVFAGGTTAQVGALKQYGAHLGCAFQIVDDLLDYQGDPTRTGKAVGNDLMEGKITLPLILTLSCAGEKDRARLLEILSLSTRNALHVAEVSMIIQQYDCFSAARNKAADAVEQALAALQTFPETEVVYERNVLAGLARYVLAREK